MKNYLLYIISGLLLLGSSCKKTFLSIPPQNGSVTINEFYDSSGVQQLLVAAYHDLTGIDVKSTWWGTSGTNWVYGDITSGDTYIGGARETGLPHQVPDALDIEHYQELARPGFLE